MGIENRNKKCAHCDRNRYSLTGANCKFHQAVKMSKMIWDEDDEKHFWNTNNCEICNKIVEGREKCVDHDHETSKYRGILCQNCNVGLGKFDDSEIIVKKAYDYISR